MPDMDQTGPYGTGPMGRRMGHCGSGFASHHRGGFDMGRGAYRGGHRCWNFDPAASQEDEKALLEQEEKALRTRLETVQKLLERLNQPEK